MTNTDVTLYRLTQTYAQVSTSFGASALTISASHPVSGAATSIPSGYWKKVYACGINGFVGTLKEDRWTWHDSIRYTFPKSTCQTIGGTSGSPIIDNSSGQLVGINNTLNESGQSCTLDNPCEVNPDGSITVIKGQNYGQETYWFTHLGIPRGGNLVSSNGIRSAASEWSTSRWRCSPRRPTGRPAWPSWSNAPAFRGPPRTGWRWRWRRTGCWSAIRTAGSSRGRGWPNWRRPRPIRCWNGPPRCWPGSATPAARAASCTGGTGRTGSAWPPPSAAPGCAPRCRSAPGCR